MTLNTTDVSAQHKPTTGYAHVNGINMYYEVHGGGEPVVLLHGAFMTITNNWAGWISELSKTRKVIAVEMQGHGRTADVPRDITYENLADDVAALPIISKSREPTLSVTARAEPWRSTLRSAIRTKCEGQSSFRPHSAVTACSRKRSKRRTGGSNKSQGRTVAILFEPAHPPDWATRLVIPACRHGGRRPPPTPHRSAPPLRRRRGQGQPVHTERVG